jgi:hypothetical protein
MGLFNAIAGGLSRVASHGRDTTMLALIFQENQGMARLVFQQFQRSAAERNIVVDDRLIHDAARETSKYPKITIGEFLDGYTNKRMSDALGRY